MGWYLKVLSQYATLNGRAGRQEFWTYHLINFLIMIAILIIETVIGSGGFLSVIYSLAVVIPGLAVTVRRLHDTKRSGWWLLITIVPVVGFLVIIYFLISPGTVGNNRYGQHPYMDEMIVEA